MRQQSRVWTYTLSAIVLLAGLSLLWEHRNQGEAVAADRTVVSKPAPQIDTNKIVPADVLGTGVVTWAPLTGDGSN
ncbi:MAG: hypothetical protein JO141_05085 [Bradyrhizobium sp.]|nr:hypothetical protein [Bradyrhizobium sp.]